MRLMEWQLAFEDYLLNPEQSAPAGLAANLIGGPTLGVETGLAIYHHAYRARLQEALRGDFPAVHHWLGDEEFDALTRAYLAACPSTHFSLRWLGEGLELFVRGYLMAPQSAPLAELLRLEWAFTLAFDAPEGTPLTLAKMASLPPEDWPGLRLSAVPSLQWLACEFNSLAVWRAVKEGAAFAAGQALAQAEVCLVWRAELRCHFRSLQADEALALSGMLHQAWDFAQLCSHVGESLGEGAALQAVTWFKQWVHEGLVQQAA